jgi:Ras homolog enriched in brain
VLVLTFIATLIIGKSSLTVQFVEGHFIESYYPTIENTFRKTVKYKGHEYQVEILDTAGQVYFGPTIIANLG